MQPKIVEKMITADVIVMATPVYFYTMSAQMKTMIDRTCTRYTEINNKEFYFIVTAADTNKQARSVLWKDFEAFWLPDGAVEKGAIYGTGVWKIGEIEHKPVLKEAYETGKNI